MWFFKKKTEKSHNLSNKIEITEDDIIAGEKELKAKMTRSRTARMKMMNDRIEFLRRKQEEAQLLQEIRDIEGDLMPDEDDFESDDDGSPEAMLMKILAPILANKMGAPVPEQNSTTPMPEAIPEQETPNIHGISLTDDKLKEIKGRFTKTQIELFNKLSDEQKRALIVAEIPDIDDDTLERAIKI